MLPEQVYFRHQNGDPVGPFALIALEVLYDARLVDERTPISPDGYGFRALGQWPEMLSHVMTVKDALGRGEDPWPATLPDVAATGAGGQINNLIGALIAHAGASATGALTVDSDSGTVEISIKDGKVVAVSTTIPDLVLSEYLLDGGLIDEQALAKAEANAPSVGGDLGAALVAQGLVEPHIYFEALVGWAKWVLGHAASDRDGALSFAEGEVTSPAVPLGFDRFGLPIEIVRDAYPIDEIREIFSTKHRCPLIPSQVEGVELENCKLQPKELRVLNRVNGVRTLKDLLTELGGTDDRDQAVLRVTFFAEQAGFVVWGQDDAGRKERAEAASLEARYERMEQLNDFELLGIDEKTSDDEVRAKYMDMVKLYHPDTIPVDSEPVLIEVRNRFFTLITDAFTRQEQEADRYQYANELERAGGVVKDDQLKVQHAILAETAFKKSEILVNVRKYEEALEQVDEALRLTPDDVEFKIHRQYIMYLIAARGGDAEPAAQEAIQQVMRMMNQNANIARGYLVLGNLHKALQKFDVAHKYFERVLEYDEDNPAALREVRHGAFRKDRKKKKRWL